MKLYYNSEHLLFIILANAFVEALAVTVYYFVYYFVIYLYKSYSYILNNDLRDVEAGGSNPLTPTK